MVQLLFFFCISIANIKNIYTKATVGAVLQLMEFNGTFNERSKMAPTEQRAVILKSHVKIVVLCL